MMGSLCCSIRARWANIFDSSLCLAALAVPMANRNVFQVDAICMVVGIAPIAGEKSLLVIVFAADDTWLVFRFFFVLFNEHRRIDFGGLSSVADGIGGGDGP